MKVVEKLQAAPEPEWILDRTGSGPMYWRRECPECNSRVKFRVEVEVKEFHRSAHELEDVEWSHTMMEESSNSLTMGLTCMLCIAVTVMLPWYIMTGFNYY